MTLDCQTLLAGQCLSWSPVRAIMVTLLWTAAALMFHEWYLEVTADG